MVSQERDASNARKKNVVAPTLREETLTREQAPARCVRQTLTRLFSGVPSRSSVAAASATAERCTGCTCRHRTWQKHTVRTTRCRHQPCLVATSTMRSYTLWCQSTKKKYENPKAKHGLPHWQHDESQARCFFFLWFLVCSPWVLCVGSRRTKARRRRVPPVVVVSSTNARTHTPHKHGALRENRTTIHHAHRTFNAVTNTASLIHAVFPSCRVGPSQSWGST